MSSARLVGVTVSTPSPSLATRKGLAAKTPDSSSAPSMVCPPESPLIVTLLRAAREAPVGALALPPIETTTGSARDRYRPAPGDVGRHGAARGADRDDGPTAGWVRPTTPMPAMVTVRQGGGSPLDRLMEVVARFHDEIIRPRPSSAPE